MTVEDFDVGEAADGGWNRPAESNQAAVDDVADGIFGLQRDGGRYIVDGLTIQARSPSLKINVLLLVRQRARKLSFGSFASK